MQFEWKAALIKSVSGIRFDFWRLLMLLNLKARAKNPSLLLNMEQNNGRKNERWESTKRWISRRHSRECKRIIYSNVEHILEVFIMRLCHITEWMKRREFFLRCEKVFHMKKGLSLFRVFLCRWFVNVEDDFIMQIRWKTRLDCCD